VRSAVRGAHSYWNEPALVFAVGSAKQEEEDRKAAHKAVGPADRRRRGQDSAANAAAIPLGPRAGGRRSGGGLGRRGFNLRFGGLACEPPQPHAKRGEDDDGDNAPPSADIAATDLHICADDDADQLAKAHEAEDYTGDSQPESWAVHNDILSGVCPLGAGLTECVAWISFASVTKPASIQCHSRLPSPAQR